MMRAIGLALERYRTDVGDYPRPANPFETESLDGVEMTVGPARTLYQTLSGDGGDAILGWSRLFKNRDPASDGITDDGATAYWEIIVDLASDDPGSGKTTIRDSVSVFEGRSGFMLIDPWGHPWQYEIFDPDYSDETRQNTHNMTYDLWSFGDDESVGNDPEFEDRWETNY